MTSRAVSAVPIDWQVQLVPGADQNAMRNTLDKAATIQTVRRTSYADVVGFEASTNNTVQTTGPGQVIAFDDNYLRDFAKEVRFLSGSRDGVLIAQQTAANLHVVPGDRVTIKRVDLPALTVTVNGVVDLPDADALFQAVGQPPQAIPQAPPDNVLILSMAQWKQAFDPQAKARPDTTRQQLHVRLVHKALPPDPVSALTFVTSAARNLEAKTAGQALVADNLGSRLGAVREDARYASVLFLFLGLPGVALALALTFAVTSSGATQRRIEQTLLRVRGAPSATVLAFSATEATVAAIAGTALGIAAALWLEPLVSELRLVPGAAAPILGLVTIGGLVAGFAAYLYPAWRDLRANTVSAARRTIAVIAEPVWRRLWLDAILLASAGLFFWQTSSTGYQIVLAPEGVAGTAVDYKAFIAPALLWLGLALLTLRLSNSVISNNGVLLRTFIRPASGALAPIVAAALSRQARRLTAGIAMTALAIAFATSTAIFNGTYNAQSRVDAELTNGSDVTISGALEKPAEEHLPALAALPDAAAAEPMQHRFAYVGSDLQDLYGIDPQRIGRATSLSDAYFSSGNAAATLAELAATPDGVLVSEETVQDFQLQQGDTINLRLIDARDHQYHPVPFKFIGVAREFPTAPKDSFLVANSRYVAEKTGSTASEYVLMKAKGDPATLAAEASTLVSDPSMKITDIGQAAHLIGSSLTAVNLAGLTTIELTFAVAAAAAAGGLMLALGLIERRRNFAILSAIGATRPQLSAFLWSEGLLIFVGGVVLGVPSGIATAWMLVKLLTGVFDPPPENLSIPWAYLGTVLSLVAIAIVMAVLAARPPRGHDAEYLRDF
ncbi:MULTISPECIES: ABC transporter permease [unclassified Rhizobium]|uniref:ABC transporter permease n=1 Tax=unclassified Rhizobium TaxID=2613769 RepID=UPI001802EB5C|nr:MULTISPECIES: ABC transporter permease [unclassified Rhizobium]MBB3386624.1 putative ABC transport system permease protein [Rhizobium sp. BK098]MBB3618328.1 putative ABC transport system permease protein [Rhizobium sp. BK609]MBB3683985.1 putative ABC transport system permease protein [Rhizobium sp. BK612]